MARQDKVLDSVLVKTLLGNKAESAYALDVHGKQLVAIEDLLEAPRLRTLDISWNGIEELGLGLQGAKQLRELRASNNKIARAPGLSECKLLEAVYLHENRFEEIPSSISALKSLKTLRLDRNRISACGPDLSHCVALTHLDLSGNSLTSVRGLGALCNIVELNLSRNEIRCIEPNAFDGSRATLQELRLAENCIADNGPISRAAATDIKKPHTNMKKKSYDDEDGEAIKQKLKADEQRLRRLRGGKSQLVSSTTKKKTSTETTPRKTTTTPSKTNPTSSLAGLQGLTSLRTLSLRRNQLTHCKGIPKLPCLNELELSENRLESIDGLELATPKIDVLALESNRLDNLETLVTSLKPLQELAELRLANNPCAAETKSGTPAYTLYLTNGLQSLRVVDNLAVDSVEMVVGNSTTQVRPLTAKRYRGLEKLEPLADVQQRASSFRHSVSGVRLEINKMRDQVGDPSKLRRSTIPNIKNTRLKKDLAHALSFSKEPTSPVPQLPPPPVMDNDVMLIDETIDDELRAAVDAFIERDAPAEELPTEDDDGWSSQEEDVAEYLRAVNKTPAENLLAVKTAIGKQNTPDISKKEEEPAVDDDSTELEQKDDVRQQYDAMMASYRAALGDLGASAQPILSASQPDASSLASSTSAKQQGRDHSISTGKVNIPNAPKQKGGVHATSLMKNKTTTPSSSRHPGRRRSTVS